MRGAGWFAYRGDMLVLDLAEKPFRPELASP
jgi:hypothetical protein